jgi:hypothetical protein
MLGHLNLGWRYMDHLPIQRLSGFKGTGNIREGNGFGCLGIGKDDRNPMRFGSLAIGNQEEEVGSGIQDIGNTVNRVSPHPSPLPQRERGRVRDGVRDVRSRFSRNYSDFGDHLSALWSKKASGNR